MPTPQTQPDEAVAEARRMFRAVLAPWASELLDLRRRGLDRPSFRRASAPVLRPGAPETTTAPAARRAA